MSSLQNRVLSGIISLLSRPHWSTSFINERNYMELDMKQLAVAIRTIAEEKNLPEDVVKEAVEQALAAAYRKDFGEREQEIRVTMNLNTGDVDALVVSLQGP